MISGEAGMNMLDDNRMWDTIIAVLLAIAGGLARLLNAKDKTKLKWSLIFSELFVSGFSGMMVLIFARAAGLTGDWVGLVCGIAGWTSPKILYALTRTTEKILKIDKDELKEEENQD